MILSDLSVRRPVLAAVLSLLLVAFGAVAFDLLPLREYPDIDTSLCETVVSDLQSSGFFSAVLPCGAKNAADIVAVA